MSEDWYTVVFEVIGNNNPSHTTYFKMRNTQQMWKVIEAFNERNNSTYTNFRVGNYTIQPYDVAGNLNLMHKVIRAE